MSPSIDSSSLSSSPTVTTEIHHHYSVARNRHHQHNSHDVQSFVPLKRFLLGSTICTSITFLKYLALDSQKPQRRIPSSSSAWFSTHTKLYLQGSVLFGAHRGFIFLMNDSFLERSTGTDNRFLAGGVSGAIAGMIFLPATIFIGEGLMSVKRNYKKLILQRGEITKKYFPFFGLNLSMHFVYWGVFLGMFHHVHSAINPYQDISVGGMNEFLECWASAEVARIVAVACRGPIFEVRNGLSIARNLRSTTASGSITTSGGAAKKAFDGFATIETSLGMAKHLVKEHGFVRGLFRSVPRELYAQMAFSASFAFAIYDRAKVACLLQQRNLN